MSGYLDPDPDLDFLPDYDANPSILVPVPAEEIQAALKLSQRIREPDKQWSVYLNAIALAGVREWFGTRSLNFSLDERHAVILEPAIADGTGAICHLVANQFRLSLIAIEPERDDEILMPQSLIDQERLLSHFYLPITVYEEQSMIGLSGYFRYDTLMEHPVNTRLSNSEKIYRLPKTWLDREMEQLLLYLNCLEPDAIPLPRASRSAWSDRISERFHQLLIQPTLNTAQWFQEQVTQLEQSFNWIVMPPVVLAGAMRTRLAQANWAMAQTEELQAILQGLTNQGLQLSSEARVAYRELSLTGADLRLYAIVSLFSPTDVTDNPPPNQLPSEWSLLLILKHQNEPALPNAIQLEIRDLATMNVIQHLQADLQTGYLFTEVIGAIAEQFLITITTHDGSSLTLPPLQWQPNS